VGAKEQRKCIKEKISPHSRARWLQARNPEMGEEQDLLSRGIILATINWPEHSRNWYYAHGGCLNLENGECIFG
jgi:hypothetical protein